MALPPNVATKKESATEGCVSLRRIGACAAHTHRERERDVRKHSNCARLIAKELCRLLRRRSWICGGPSRLVGCLLHDVIVDAVYGGRFLFWRSACQGFLLLRRLGLPAKGKATALLGGHRRQIVLVLSTENGKGGMILKSSLQRAPLTMPSTPPAWVYYDCSSCHRLLPPELRAPLDAISSCVCDNWNHWQRCVRRSHRSTA